MSLNDEDAPTAARDVVFTFSWLTWDGAQRRGMVFPEDRLAAALIISPRVRRLVVANWFRSLPLAAGRSALLRDGQSFPADDHVSLHQPLRLRRSDPVRLPAIERAYRDYDRRLRRVAERRGLQRPVVVTAHPLVAGLAPLEWASSVTYYATDDWVASPGYRRFEPALEQAYTRIRETGRRVCAVSNAILERLAPTAPSAVVPNGVEPTEWLAPSRPAGTWLRDLPGPRILYLGTLDTRLDAGLLGDLAQRFQRGSIILVGPVTDARHVARCAEPANVHIRPAVGRELVPALLSDADLCVVPHVRTEFTAAMSPLKVYEYLAAGRPVAAVDLAPIAAVGESRIVLSSDGANFADAAAQALQLGPAPENERQAFVARHAWARRHEQVLDLALPA